MEVNLEKLLKKCSLDKKDYLFLEDGKLLKIIGNKDKTKYLFKLEIENTLPVDMYKNLEQAIKSAFNCCKDINLRIISKNVKTEYASDYFKYCIEKYKTDNPLLELFLTSEVLLSNQKLQIKVSNKAEQMKLNGLESLIINDFKNFGFNNIKMEYLISEEHSQKIRNEIEADINKYSGLDIKEPPKSKTT